MRKNSLYDLLLMAILPAGCSRSTIKHQSAYPEPPHLQKINKEMTIHGATAKYHWFMPSCLIRLG
ncbi:MAG: hypothetical protein D4R64_11945 [Porphyromonadaceae bacterium]|nr:MAG: hypothetical protein D4R64_11945 [Porphyromonadaceae bacterium]